MTYQNQLARCGNGHTIFWMPVLGPDDEPYDRDKFTPNAIASLKIRPEVWRSQYLLLPPGEVDSVFDESRLAEAMFEWLDPLKTAMRYQGFEFDPDNLDEHGFAAMAMQPASVSLSHCRFYMHVDPKHKLKAMSRLGGAKQRPSAAAIVVVAVAPDHHVFVVDYWTDDAGLEGVVAKMLTLYVRWAPYKVTWESVGAQYWVREHVVAMERLDARYRHPRAITRYGMVGELPRMSSRMVEGDKTNQSKEFVARVSLSGWINTGALHLDKARSETIQHQLAHILDDKEAVDLVDCLGQGPAVWTAPPAPGAADDLFRRKAFVSTFVQGGTSTGRSRRTPAGLGRPTGFRSPWR